MAVALSGVIVKFASWLSDALDNENFDLFFDSFAYVSEDRFFVVPPITFVDRVGLIEPGVPFGLIFGAVIVGGITASGGFGAETSVSIDASGFQSKLDVHDLEREGGMIRSVDAKRALKSIDGFASFGTRTI